MPISDYPLAAQLHADRTARIVSDQRLLRLPNLHLPRFGRKEQRRVATRLAPNC